MYTCTLISSMYKKLLRREGAFPRVMGHFYKAIVQAVLLYGAESWVLTPQLITKLRTFHRKAARFITKADESGEWVYPDSASVLEDAGLFEIETNCWDIAKGGSKFWRENT